MIYGIIYKYTNPLNNKSYIGQTINENRRKYEHAHITPNPKKCKPIYKCDKKGNIICSYNSLKEASADTGILLGGISKVLIGNRPTAGGYIWKYKN